MNLSKRQVDCLSAMGIQLWQPRELATTKPLLTAKPLAVEPQAEAVVQSPLLIAQLERAIDYCQQHSNNELELSWKIDQSLEQVELADTELSLPNLTKVFASSTLKQQLWHLIHHANK